LVDDSGNGNGTVAELEQTESPEQIQGLYAKLSELKRGDGSLVTLSKQDMSLMQKILTTGNEAYKDEQFWRMCSFLDEDEAKDHVDAFYEAKDLGMDTGFNVSYAFALVATNRKTAMTNLIAQLTDTLQHGKWAGAAQQGNKGQGHGNSRSPIS
jgi:hypothetical protein